MPLLLCVAEEFDGRLRLRRVRLRLLRVRVQRRCVVLCLQRMRVRQLQSLLHGMSRSMHVLRVLLCLLRRCQLELPRRQLELQ